MFLNFSSLVVPIYIYLYIHWGISIDLTCLKSLETSPTFENSMQKAWSWIVEN